MDLYRQLTQHVCALYTFSLEPHVHATTPFVGTSAHLWPCVDYKSLRNSLPLQPPSSATRILHRMYATLVFKLRAKQ